LLKRNRLLNWSLERNWLLNWLLKHNWLLKRNRLLVGWSEIHSRSDRQRRTPRKLHLC
jgi:hypothetical protein